MADKGDIYMPLNRRHGRIRPHAVGMSHLALGRENVTGGDLDLDVLLSEVGATRARARAVLYPGPAAGHLKIVRVAASSKEVTLLPTGGTRVVMRAGDVWFGVWNGKAWLTIFCSVKAVHEPVPEAAAAEQFKGAAEPPE